MGTQSGHVSNSPRDPVISGCRHPAANRVDSPTLRDLSFFGAVRRIIAKLSKASV